MAPNMNTRFAVMKSLLMESRRKSRMAEARLRILMEQRRRIQVALLALLLLTTSRKLTVAAGMNLKKKRTVAHLFPCNPICTSFVKLCNRAPIACGSLATNTPIFRGRRTNTTNLRICRLHVVFVLSRFFRAKIVFYACAPYERNELWDRK